MFAERVTCYTFREHCYSLVQRGATECKLSVNLSCALVIGVVLWAQKHLVNVRARQNEFVRMPCALTPRLGLWLPYTPRELALREGLPGLHSWLASDRAPSTFNNYACALT